LCLRAPVRLWWNRSRLGYQPDGTLIKNRDGRPVTELRFALTRNEWAQHHHDSIDIAGLTAEAADMFGGPS